MLLIVLVLFLIASWKLSYQVTWHRVQDIRTEQLYKYDEESFQFDKNYGDFLFLDEVVSLDSRESFSLPKYPNFIFYYFASDVDTLTNAQKLYSSVKFLQYLFEQKNLEQDKYLILICGKISVLAKLNLLKTQNLKFINRVAVNPSIYRKLSLSNEQPAVIITNKKGKIVWCSLRRPSDSLLSQLVEKFIEDKSQ